MPELPEVETLCRQLRTKIIGLEITGTFILDGKIEMPGNLKGQRVISVNRRGKRIVIGMDNGKSLEIHLRMTGRLIWQETRAVPPPHSRFVFDLSSNQVMLVDPRRFATLSLREEAIKQDEVVDALAPGCAEFLIAEGRNRRRPLKSFLMDQQIIEGIGNIYACEILHRVGLSPWRETASLSPDDWREMEKAMGTVLSKAIDCRGTSISDWRDLFGNKGDYQNELRVYSREGVTCLRCGGIIHRKRLLGRGTWFCPGCQA
ncbi:formamidopyrimidine-DNA glycosylase [Syntrophus gentianae]|uniref:Formamidopyrimidine-DNA glycosylase n=1 Tax=Syntrophus gentianae TaxID=43775 RepID=A0A1H7Y0E6_9BACT|nr:bifunctional DNA-formamidopyrimidine glycosylase/DNA-(apurinic or apyrimidinic site) lyase [Syntrophus gentianae]SEM38818.1 formamidopyrimidine-DNA glycosylase [Syntrophus gentianae]